MGIRANGFRERITVVTFIAMQKQSEQYFFDATIEQATELIWKQFPTAVIIYADEYVLAGHKNISISKKKLTDQELQKFYKTNG